MKKLLTAALLIVTAISLTACGNDEPADYDIPRESAIILNDLPYSSYLSSNNPVMTIEVERMGEMKLQLFQTRWVKVNQPLCFFYLNLVLLQHPLYWD